MRGSLSLTLSLYILRQFLVWFLVVTVALLGIIFLAECVELLRRSARFDVPLALLLQMAALKTPTSYAEVLPFAVLASSLGAYWRLTRSHEMVVARAAGVSVWQFLVPTVLAALLLGATQVLLFDSIDAAMMRRFKTLEAAHLQEGVVFSAQASNGLWLRQTDPNGAETVIHAARISPAENLLRQVVVLNFVGDSRFIGRIDADSATLRSGDWTLRDAWVSRPNRPAEKTAEVKVPTPLTFEQILESFAARETLSFWELPRYIGLLEETGLSARPHRLAYERLLASPLQVAAMVLLAAAFALRPHRFGGTAALIGAGIGTGFLLYFLSSFLFNLGRNSAIPIELAAWTPAVVSTFVGISLLLHLEDG